MTNPLNVVPEAEILQQLCSDSVLLIRRDDVISHWTDSCDLTVLIRQQDPQWRIMNVLGELTLYACQLLATKNVVQRCFVIQSHVDVE